MRTFNELSDTAKEKVIQDEIDFLQRGEPRHDGTQWTREHALNIIADVKYLYDENGKILQS